MKVDGQKVRYERQTKRKHFKRLYEESLPKKPYPVIYQTHSAQHYRVCNMIDERDIAYAQPTPQLLKTHIENGILRELRPLIWDNLKVEKDLHTDKFIYSLDFWI